MVQVNTKKIRILLCRLGVDTHTRATEVLAKAFRDAGMEVILLGIGVTPKMAVDVALQEDVDVIAISSHDNFHRKLVPQVIELLEEGEMSNIAVVAGGIIPSEDKVFLESLGVSGFYGPGIPLQVITDHVKSRVQNQLSLK